MTQESNMSKLTDLVTNLFHSDLMTAFGDGEYKFTDAGCFEKYKKLVADFFKTENGRSAQSIKMGVMRLIVDNEGILSKFDEVRADYKKDLIGGYGYLFRDNFHYIQDCLGFIMAETHTEKDDDGNDVILVGGAKSLRALLLLIMSVTGGKRPDWLDKSAYFSAVSLFPDMFEKETPRASNYVRAMQETSKPKKTKAPPKEAAPRKQPRQSIEDANPVREEEEEEEDDRRSEYLDKIDNLTQEVKRLRRECRIKDADIERLEMQVDKYRSLAEDRKEHIRHQAHSVSLVKMVYADYRTASGAVPVNQSKGKEGTLRPAAVDDDDDVATNAADAVQDDEMPGHRKDGVDGICVRDA